MTKRALLSCFVAAWLSITPGAVHAQQSRDLSEVRDLVNEGFGAVAALRAQIIEAERRLSELETSLLISTARPTAAIGASRLATDIAQHPLVLTAKPLCRDAFRELTVERSPARLGVISSCIGDLDPQARHETGFECASLFWNVAPNGDLRLNGHVQGPEDYGSLTDMYGATTVAAVVERPFPACAALEALELPLTSQAKPGLRLLSNQNRVAFRDSLAFEVTTPDFFAYVYVVYLQADGSVVNLTPRTRLLREQYRPLSTLRFGDGQDGRQTYTASAPAGSEAIIVVTSRSPIDSLDTLEIGPRGQFALNSNGRPLDQTGFLDLLRIGMEEEHNARGSREISAEVLHITVVP